MVFSIPKIQCEIERAKHAHSVLEQCRSDACLVAEALDLGPSRRDGPS